jgi:hypothetical protein
VQAQLGLTEVWLAAGDSANACSEAASLLEATLKTAELTLLARTWEIRARVAMATDQQRIAHDCVRNPMATLE